MIMKKKFISYCTTCCNRLWQLALSLPGNLKRLKENEELILVNYGSTDNLTRYIQSSKLCLEFIENKKLIYAEVLNVKTYHSSKAKNIAHRLGNGKFLVNLDADNFNIGINNEFQKHKYKNVIVHLWSKVAWNGTFGKIAISKNNFYRLGGYDESLLPMGFQDIDLLNRANAMDIKKMERPLTNKFIFNSVEEKIKFTGRSDWHECNHANYLKSNENIKNNKLIANKESGWGDANLILNLKETIKLKPIIMD